MSDTSKNGRALTNVFLAAENIIAAESHAVVKETVYDREMDIAYLMGLLRNQRVTGTLRIDISQGTVNAVRLEERQKL